ncbi:MAG: hypothetical protein ABSE63_10430, partial [Thermoguttaceae bacterium]
MSTDRSTNRPVHFTYQPVDETGPDLCQGDILQQNDEIRSLLADVHPHFNDDKYNAFLVLTQTCDLERRDGQPCKSRYINLAVVRPLRDVLFFLLNRDCDKVKIGRRYLEGVYTSESRDKAERLLSRILNQNAQSEGLFYLHNDLAVRIAEPSVAFLQVSVAVRAQDHYDRLIGARSGRLKEQFQSKLGWLIGNLFSRVATEDMPTTQRKQIIAEFLNTGGSHDTDPFWVPKANIV